MSIFVKFCKIWQEAKGGYMQKVSAENNTIKYKEMFVKKLGIFELRALARELGVSSPTTKRRNELVSLILEKLQLGQGGQNVASKKGRPFKKLSSIDEILDYMADPSQEKEEIINFPTFEQLICFAQEKPNTIFINDKKETLCGVVRNSNSTLYFIDLEKGNKVFLTDEICEKYNLDKGDFLVCDCVGINTSNQFLVKEVLEINFVSAKDRKVDNVDLGRAVISEDRLAYGEKFLNVGRRNLVFYDKDIYQDDRFSRFASQCVEDGMRVVVIGSNISFENDILFKNIKGLVRFTSLYGESPQSSFDKVVDAITFVEKQISLGQKVVVFVCDIIEVVRSLDKYFAGSDICEDCYAQTLVILQKLLSLGRAYSSLASATLLISCREMDREDIILKNEIIKVCNII